MFQAGLVGSYRSTLTGLGTPHRTTSTATEGDGMAGRLQGAPTAPSHPEPPAAGCAGMADARRVEDAEPRYGQLAICCDTDREAAREGARAPWRRAGPGWHVMSELPEPRSFAAASAQVSEDDIEELVPSGPDVASHAAAPGNGPTPDSPTWPWSRWAGTFRRSSWPGPRVSFSPHYGNSAHD